MVFKAIEHSLERGDILRIAGKHLVADGKAFPPDRLQSGRPSRV
jgi:hypothetical protein